MSSRSLFRVAQQFRPETSLSRLGSILDDLANPLSKMRIKQYHLSIFDDIVRLGEGSSYIVDRGRFLDKELVAVKRTLFAETGRVESSDENGQYSFQDQLELLYIEVRALSHPPLVNHPNIVKLLGYGWSVSQGISLPFVVVEYAELGTLDAYLRNSSLHLLEEKLQLSHDVACGLNALHACKIIHGDVKMANVLLYENHHASRPIAKLSDFGHAVLWSATRLYEPLYGGTHLFNAPEVFAQDFEPIAAETMPKCDVYSYGLLLWGVLKDGLSYFENSWLGDGEEDKIEFLQSVAKGWLATQAVQFVDTLTHLPEGMHGCLRDLLQRCLEYENARRPDISNVINILEHLSTFISERQVINILPLQERILDEAAYTDLGPTEFIRTYPSWPAETRKELYAGYGLEHSRSPRGFGSIRRAECHALGFGAREDIDQVLYWIGVSADEGYFPARLCIDRLKEAHITPMGSGTPTDKEVSIEIQNQIRVCQELNDRLATVETHLYYSTRVRMALRTVTDFTVHHNKVDEDFESIYGPSVTFVIRSSGLKQSSLGAEMPPALGDDGLHPTHDLDLLTLALFNADNAEFEAKLKVLPLGALNAFDSSGVSLVLFACVQGNATAVHMLLSKGAHGNQQDHQGHGALHYLNQFEPNDMATVAKALVAAGANPNAQSKSPKWFVENYFVAWGTPLHWAVAANNIAVVEELLTLGADPLLSTIEGIDSPHDHFTPLHLAAGLWLPEMTALLLRSANYGTFPGYWPLHMMTRAPPLQKWMIHGKGWQEAAGKTVRVLLESGHKVDQLDHTGMTPLCCAVWLLPSELCAGPVVRELLAQGANQNAIVGQFQQPLCHYAIEGLDSNEDNVGLIPILWEHGADFNIPDPTGTTPLMLACRYKEDTVVKYLLSKGIYVHERTQHGSTAFHQVALTNVSEGTIKALLAAGLPIDVPDGIGTTPLGTAISSGHLETADILLSCGASLYVNQNIDENHTILHHALRFAKDPKRAVFHLLGPGPLARRQDIRHVVNNQYIDGFTALHSAVMTMNYACAQELVAAGANPQLVSYRMSPAGQSVVRLAEDCLFVDGFLPYNDRTLRGNQRYRRMARRQVMFFRSYSSRQTRT